MEQTSGQYMTLSIDFSRVTDKHGHIPIHNLHHYNSLPDESMI